MSLPLFSALVQEWRTMSLGTTVSSSCCGTTPHSSNQRTNVSVARRRRAATLKGECNESLPAGSSLVGTRNRGYKAHALHGPNVRCQSTNGAHVGRSKINNTTLIGLGAEDQIVDAANTLGDEPLLAQNGRPCVERFSGADSEEDANEFSEGFATIDDAVKAVREGKFVLVVDDENRENEGDLIMAGSLVTPQAMAFLVKHSTGIVCVGMKGEDLDRLQLPLMVPQRHNKESSRTAFTWTVDAKAGTTTGVSAEDRCKTIQALASPTSTADDFVAPGHTFPLRYREGGVLKRRGHTEAALDLATLAGLAPAGVLCEVVNDEDGSMARLPYLMKFAKLHGLPIISIDALVKYRIAKEMKEVLVTRTAQARLPTTFGEFQVYSYMSNDGLEHAALVAGDISSGVNVYVRVHSECLTGDVFGSTRCDCGSQLADSLRFINEMGRGIVVYMRGHEGRGIGLGHKMKAYNLQDAGCDTVEANLQLGLPVDSRDYSISAQMLQDLGVQTITLLSNNPAKVQALKAHGIGVDERRSIFSPVTKENRRYLETKRVRMGHVYSSRLPAVGLSTDNDREGGDLCNSESDAST